MVLVLHSGLFTEDRAHVEHWRCNMAYRACLEKIYADAGGLMSYGPDLSIAFRRAADYVDRIAGNKTRRSAGRAADQDSSW